MTKSLSISVQPSRLGLRLGAALLFMSALALCAQAEAARIKTGGAAPEQLPSLSAILPADVASTLVADGKVVRTAAPDKGPSLMPTHIGAESIAAKLALEKPGLLVEALYAYRRPRPADPVGELRSIYGTLLAISSLQGIEYWSASRKTMRTFYADSWRIDNPESRIRLPDPTAPEAGPLPQLASYYAFQRDLTFGANTYRISYTSYPDAIILESVNVTKLSYKGIPVLKPEGLRIRVLIVQTAEALLFYAASAGDVPNLPIIRNKVEESVTNRMEALYKWFSGRQSTGTTKPGA